jgi:hypothetical protein
MRGGFLLASGLPLSSLKSGGCSAGRIMCYLARDHACRPLHAKLLSSSELVIMGAITARAKA